VPQEEAAGLGIWLTMPEVAPNIREVAPEDADVSTRFKLGTATVRDNASALQNEQHIEIAIPRLEIALRRDPRPGYQSLRIGEIIEVTDGVIKLNDQVPPVALTIKAHPAIEGYLTRVIGWMEAKLAMLARYAADPTSGGGMQNADYFMLMLLNRELPALRHLAGQRAVHPERLYDKLVSIAGELCTFDHADRQAKDYGGYRHDDLQESFSKMVLDIQQMLSIEFGKAVRLPLEQRNASSYVALVTDRQLFANAAFVLDVSSSRSLTEIQDRFPKLCKIGPSTRMREIINASLPGVPMVHLPTPPKQLRGISSHVYFLLDKSDVLWSEFSTAPAFGLHFSGDWKDLKLELWAVPE
jgi:type VI secretion system protein ImpJ